MTAPPRPPDRDLELAGPPGRVADRVLRTRRVVLAAVGVLAVLALAAATLWRTSPPHAARPHHQHPTAAPGTTPAAPASALTVSSRRLDLGTSTDVATFEVINSGDAPAIYQVSCRAGWLSVSPIGGGLPGGASVRVTAVADRTAVPRRTSRARVLVTWEGGSARVDVSIDR